MSNQSNANVLQNSGFDVFTNANVPDNWILNVGTAGTDLAKETSVVFGGSAGALALIGNGGGTGVLVNLTQAFNTAASTVLGSGGTPYNILLKPAQNFILNYQIKGLAGAPAAGVLTWDLIDGSNTVIQDDNGTNQAGTLTLSTITSSYVAHSLVFRLPAVMPTTVKLRLRVTTAISTGTTVYLDDVALVAAVGLYSTMPPLYGSGPQFAIFRGATTPLVGDAWTMALTISTAGAFQRAYQRLFNMPGLGLALPSKADGSETSADTLIA